MGLQHRLAFAVTAIGAVLLIAGVLALGVAALARDRPRAASGVEERNLIFTGLLVLFGALGALRGFSDDPAGGTLTLAAVLVFVLLEPVPWLRRRRLWVVVPMILAAHVVLVWELAFPKEDVFRFLTYGVDGLFHRGVNPYLPIHDPVSPDVKLLTFTYPPGALLVVAPFRLLLGDVRWAFVAAEAVFVAAVALDAGRQRSLTTWRQALVLLPLVLPGTSQAYFRYGNHEWILLAIAAVALLARRRWALSGVLLGIGMASKQYFVIFPVLFLARDLDRRALAVAGGAAIVVMLPFLAWDPAAMIRDLLGQLGAPPDPYRLTVYGILRGSGIDVGARGALLLAGIGAGSVLACLGYARRGIGPALMACGVALCLFSLFADYAAYNYYGYALALFAWGLALSGAGDGEEAGSPPGVLGVAG